MILEMKYEIKEVKECIFESIGQNKKRTSG